MTRVLLLLLTIAPLCSADSITAQPANVMNESSEIPVFTGPQGAYDTCRFDVSQLFFGFDTTLGTLQSISIEYVVDANGEMHIWEPNLAFGAEYQVDWKGSLDTSLDVYFESAGVHGLSAYTENSGTITRFVHFCSLGCSTPMSNYSAGAFLITDPLLLSDVTGDPFPIVLSTLWSLRWKLPEFEGYIVGTTAGPAIPAPYVSQSLNVTFNYTPSSTATAVPEPRPGWLVISAFVLLIVCRFRRSSRLRDVA
jgi:hypothetical protein